MITYLKNHQYYIDLYDKHTVELCRSIERNRVVPEVPKRLKVSKQEAIAVSDTFHNFHLKLTKGERYLKKDETIAQWMNADRARDELLESATPPEDIRCLTCWNRLSVIHKDLWHGDTNTPERVLFMYECPNQCLPRRAFFNDGEEWKRKPHRCSHCTHETKQTMSDDGVTMVTTYTCPQCKYVEADEYVWSKQTDEYDEHFAADRDRFCLTEEEGREFQDMKWRLEQMSALGKEFEEEQKAREKRLEENPKGFHLEEAGYTCAICQQSTPKGDNWYDRWGIKCLVCQWAIDHKEIPPSLAKHTESWYTRHDFQHYFNIKTPTLNKWIRNDTIKARTISHYGEGVHTQVFLIKDNKGFLPSKKLVESRSVRVVEEGKEYVRSHPWYHFGDPHEILKGYGIMDHLRVVSAEEMEQKEAERQAKVEKRKILKRKK